MTLANVELDPVLVYPLDPPRHWMQPPDRGDGTDRHLAAGGKLTGSGSGVKELCILGQRHPARVAACWS
ncbi:hypothetical protein E1295_00240 [Nonomuraea mesophila]|uniref:Uncharacterized protein n=1 Tax=Nonomuraea mesophila TaxID=2530382 RepID=A0A4R5FY13_9ACTN|nr:hypothetical protein [Nonomuraea mesophila]TDE60312.1 hypothetical protein E1295_00240 [Nonomuraea mesophila]